jgi:hypothetical protein
MKVGDCRSHTDTAHWICRKARLYGRLEKSQRRDANPSKQKNTWTE